jgi:hypothetical protein
MKNTRIIPMRRLPGPASWPLCDGVKTPEAPVELFRGWQRTQTQSSVRTLRSLRQQMDVWFCLMQESSAERHCCVTAGPDQINCAPSRARPGILCFSLDLDLHRCGQFGIIKTVVVLCLERPRDSAQTVGNQSAAGSQQVSCGLMQMMPTRLSIAGEPR